MKGMTMKATKALLAATALAGGLAFSETTASRPWMDATLAPDARARLILKAMTLEEKVAETILVPIHNACASNAVAEGRAGMILQSKPTEDLLALQQLKMRHSRLGIPLLFQEDVIHGWRTIAPIPLASACSWDDEAVEKGEAAAAREAAAAGMNLSYAPMLDISEDPRWGRIMETNGEDPYLSGRMAAARVRGFQGREEKDLLRDDKVAACAKHFLGYASLQGGRDYCARDFSWRDVLETYAVPYRWANEAGVASVMCSYLQWNGEFVTFCPALRDLLRNDIGFDGLYMTDWGTMEKAVQMGVAADSRDAAEKAMTLGGLDMDMASFSYTNLVALVRDGKVEERLVDEAARRALALKFRCGLFDDPYRHLDAKRRDAVVGDAASRAAAQELAEKSIVLFKNNGVLPLARGAKFAVVGPYAHSKTHPIGQWKCRGEESETVTLAEGLVSVFGKENVVVQPGEDGKELVTKCATFADALDTVVVAIGESRFWSGEYFNTSRLSVPGEQVKLVRDAKEAGKKVVAVVYAGRPVVMREIDALADAVVYAWFPGTMGGPAVARILAGDVNPQAKTVQTFYWDAGQVLNTYRARRTWDATGYADLPQRDAKNHATCPVLYPFGFGLSYTTYAYSAPTVTKTEYAPDESVTVSVKVRNVGAVAGREAVQVYKCDERSSVLPRERELCEFRTVDLAPGEEKTVAFTLPPESFKVYDRTFARVLEPGAFTLYVGPDSTTTNAVRFAYR